MIPPEQVGKPPPRPLTHNQTSSKVIKLTVFIFTGQTTSSFPLNSTARLPLEHFIARFVSMCAKNDSSIATWKTYPLPQTNDKKSSKNIKLTVFNLTGKVTSPFPLNHTSCLPRWHLVARFVPGCAKNDPSIATWKTYPLPQTNDKKSSKNIKLTVFNLTG